MSLLHSHLGIAALVALMWAVHVHPGLEERERVSVGEGVGGGGGGGAGLALESRGSDSDLISAANSV